MNTIKLLIKKRIIGKVAVVAMIIGFAFPFIVLPLISNSEMGLQYYSMIEKVIVRFVPLIISLALVEYLAVFWMHKKKF